jgi:hypothetical protein
MTSIAGVPVRMLVSPERANGYHDGTIGRWNNQ